MAESQVNETGKGAERQRPPPDSAPESRPIERVNPKRIE